MRRMTVDFTDETFERIREIQKMYDVDIDVIVAVAILGRVRYIPMQRRFPRCEYSA